MSEPSTPPPSGVERWVSWVALLGAIVLGWVLLWALGWSRAFGPIGSDGPVHAMTRVRCEIGGVLGLLFFSAVFVAVAALLIGRAINRGGWWQAGLWAGFILIADALLVAQYTRFLLPLAGPCLD